MKDYYKILGVSRDAEEVVIRASYRALAQKYHPDKLGNDNSVPNQKMVEINEAYSVLSDKRKKHEYDSLLKKSHGHSSEGADGLHNKSEDNFKTTIDELSKFPQFPEKLNSPFKYIFIYLPFVVILLFAISSLKQKNEEGKNGDIDKNIAQSEVLVDNQKVNSQQINIGDEKKSNEHEERSNTEDKKFLSNEEIEWEKSVFQIYQKEYKDVGIHTELVKMIHEESKRAGIDFNIGLALVESISKFNKFAVGKNGSLGYMGVNPTVASTFGLTDASTLFHLQANLRYGFVFFKHYKDINKGDIDKSIQDYYNYHLTEYEDNMTSEIFEIRVKNNSAKWLKLKP